MLLKTRVGVVLNVTTWVEISEKIEARRENNNIFGTN